VGNVIDPTALVSAYGLDPVRYFLLREVPFGQDGNYSHEAIVARMNSELANDLGNLAQRSLSMIGKNCDGVLPTPGEFTAADEAILAASGQLLQRCRAAVDRQELHVLLSSIVSVVSETNRYFAGEEPWVLRKTDPARMGTVLYVTAEVLRRVAILLQPVMPGSIAKLLDLLGVSVHERGFDRLSQGLMLEAGQSLPPPSGVFPRYVEPVAEES
jgi:methionyl-tRNA synthetase